MKRKIKKNDSQNIKIAFYFCIAIFFILFVSFSLKLIHILQKSTFDGQHQFVLYIKDDTNARLISFSPQNNKISEIDTNAVNNFGTLAALPTDGVVQVQGALPNSGVSATLTSLLVHYKDIKTDATIADLFRLLWFSRGISDTNESVAVIKKDDNLSAIEDSIASLFVDPTITDENQTIEIENGTDTTGLGNRFARLLTHMGANVVMVTSTQNSSDTSSVMFSSKKSYTAARIAKMLHVIPSFSSEKSIADVIIVLGKNTPPDVLAKF